ncbi:helix-turn-helix domain-containing protein [Nocardia brasiliensis]|uniref:Helix-turn-helix domain-containing protein n=1 Tax=Nocardia brasiliensis TaxID=37326 RepID=A0A6G9XJ73_NOCBR|nr:helix-turn-helix transcriptional regulator [Nocardia brasiliensis]QIS00967.1 helix-turn-helix domain-containing protein [Nocardia brasiliensis]
MGRAAIGPAGPHSRALAGEIRAEMGRQNGLTLKDLAAASGLKPTYLGSRIRGESPLNLNDIEAVAAALGLSFAALIQRGVEAAAKAIDEPADAEPVGPLVTSRGTRTGRSSAARVRELKQRAATPRQSS